MEIRFLSHFSDWPLCSVVQKTLEPVHFGVIAGSFLGMKSASHTLLTRIQSLILKPVLILQY